MERTWGRALVGVALLLALEACGARSGTSDAKATPRAGVSGGGGPVMPQADPGGDPPMSTPSTGVGGGERCKDITIRIVGAKPDVVSTFGVVLGHVSVTGDGTRIAVEGAPLGTALDLSSDGADAALGKFAFPEGDAPLTVEVAFSSGHSVRAGVAADLEACTAPMSFTFSPGRLVAPACEISLVLDVGRSIVPNDDGALAFLPRFQVFFF